MKPNRYRVVATPTKFAVCKGKRTLAVFGNSFQAELLAQYLEQQTQAKQLPACKPKLN